MINLIEFTTEELEVGDIYLNGLGQARRITALKAIDDGASYVVDSVRVIDGTEPWKATWNCDETFLVLIEGEEV